VGITKERKQRPRKILTGGPQTLAGKTNLAAYKKLTALCKKTSSPRNDPVRDSGEGGRAGKFSGKTELGGEKKVYHYWEMGRRIRLGVSGKSDRIIAPIRHYAKKGILFL